MKHLLILVFLIPFLCHSQEYDKKSFGVGLGTFIASNNQALPLPYSVSLIGSCKRHELSLGTDIYNSHDIIFGVHTNHKYHLLKSDKIFNVFTDFSLHYIDYGMGGALPVRYYNYSQPDNNWIQTRSLLNTLGLGIRFCLAKRYTFYSVFSGGYNYYERKYSPTNTEEVRIGGFYTGSYAVPVFYIKLGVSAKLWRRSANK